MNMGGGVVEQRPDRQGSQWAEGREPTKGPVRMQGGCLAGGLH